MTVLMCLLYSMDGWMVWTGKVGRLHWMDDDSIRMRPLRSYVIDVKYGYEMLC